MTSPTRGRRIDDPTVARQRARRHRARLPHRRVRPGRPALPAHGPHGRAVVRRQRRGDPQPARARVSPTWPRRSTTPCPTTPRRASRGRGGVLLGAGLHRARGAAVRALHPPVHPRLAAPSRRPPAEPRPPVRRSRRCRRWPTTRTTTCTWTCSRARCSSSTTTTCSTGARPTRTTSRTATNGTSSGCGWPRYALTDRPAPFAALGRRSHWEARRSVSTLPAVERAAAP